MSVIVMVIWFVKDWHNKIYFFLSNNMINYFINIKSCSFDLYRSLQNSYFRKSYFASYLSIFSENYTFFFAIQKILRNSVSGVLYPPLLEFLNNISIIHIIYTVFWEIYEKQKSYFFRTVMSKKQKLPKKTQKTNIFDTICE